MNRRNDVVTASEIASWAWCPESWRLQSLGAVPSNRAEMARGEKRHSLLAFIERWSRSAITLGWYLLAFGVLVALVACLALFLAGDS